MAALRSNVALAWTDRRDDLEQGEAYYRGSADAGMSWDDEERISFTSSDTWIGGIAVTPGYVHVIYNDQGGAAFYRRRALAPTDADTDK